VHQANQLTVFTDLIRFDNMAASHHHARDQCRPFLAVIVRRFGLRFAWPLGCA
jgi:hypothetical protein